MLARLGGAFRLKIKIHYVQPLGLSFPYNWSNPAMTLEEMTLAVLERGLFDDLLEAARFWGLEQLQSVAQKSQLPPGTQRMLRNIAAGFAQA